MAYSGISFLEEYQCPLHATAQLFKGKTSCRTWKYMHSWAGLNSREISIETRSCPAVAIKHSVCHRYVIYI